MRRRYCERVGAVVLAVGLVFVARTVAQGQGSDSGPEKKEEMNDTAKTADAKGNSAVSVYHPVQSSSSKTRNLLLDFLNDEKALWTSPKDLRFEDTVWLVPISGFTAGLFVTDADVSRHLSHDPTTLSHYNTLSDAGVVALVGGAGGMWLLSHYNHNDHWQETGFLSGEAAIHSLIMTEAFKYSFRRDRPYQGNGTGPFFQPGGTSFPSEHSAAAWSVAAVIAHEYPGILPKILAYGAAGLVSYSRVHAEKHFPSDVMVGALIGELSAYKVYSRHHDPELGGDAWESWSSQAKELFEHPNRDNMGSPYVPMDSWIYPAIERLMGLGLIDSGFLGHRPWTRVECARLLSEAEDRVNESGEEASRIYTSLEEEFRSELGPAEGGLSATLESVYSRVTQISGRPLGPGGESFDFGQTIINDYGRPYAEGTNAVAGFSFYTTAGPWVGYVQGEYQYAPSAPPLTLSERTFMASYDGYESLGIPPANAIATTGQFRLVEAYAGLQFSNWLFSFGPQEMWGGPTEGGPMLLSDNSQAIPMFRIARTSPMKIPLLSKLFGPAWFELFMGQLGGQYIFRSPTNGLIGNYLEPLQNQPYIHGERISFKPTRNFEFGVTRTVIFGGGDIPMTLGYFGRSLINKGEHHTPKGTPYDPGKQASGLDWSYRLPMMRNWVSFYGDAFAWDQLSPIAYWDRSAISAGLYLSHVPKIPRLDFRVEGVYSDVPAGGNIGHGFYYSSGSSPYLQGYTNGGNLMGSWIGRDGQGAQAWTNYWFNAKDRLQFYFRHEKVSQQFLPGGGTLTDVGTTADYWFGQSVGISATVQYERWLFPVIQPGPQRNVSTSLGIQFQPQKILKPSLHRLLSDRTEVGDAN
jgi:capsule assembly protein Wzi/PAP2 superfamily protein